MNNGPEEIEVGEGVPGAEGISEPAMDAMLRAQLGKPMELPAGFKERVLARAAAESAATESRATGGPFAVQPADATTQVVEPAGRGKLLTFPRAAVWRLVAAGALAASVIGATFGVQLERGHHEATQRAAQERMVANQQFEEATRITDAALAHTRDQLQRAGVFEDEGR